MRLNRAPMASWHALKSQAQLTQLPMVTKTYINFPKKGN